MTDELVWEEPPSKILSRSNAKWAGVLDKLRQRPGEWARITTGTKRQMQSLRFNITRGKYSGVEEGEFEVKVGELQDGDQFGAWARYVGDGSGQH